MCLLKGFVKVKKSKNPRKTRQWVGHPCPNSDFFFVEILCFFCVFGVFFIFPNVSKKLEFFSDFWIFQLDKTPNWKCPMYIMFFFIHYHQIYFFIPLLCCSRALLKCSVATYSVAVFLCYLRMPRLIYFIILQGWVQTRYQQQILCSQRTLFPCTKVSTMVCRRRLLTTMVCRRKLLTTMGM